MKIRLFGRKDFFDNKKNLEGSPEELYQRALKLWDEGNTGDGYTLMQAAAELHHPEAAFRMGEAIRNKCTFGTEKDVVRYFEIAANAGHIEAMTNLAVCYQLGKGTKANPIKGLNLLKTASEKGDDMAFVNLGQTYLLGVGIPKDEKRGWKILLEMAAKGNEMAIDTLRNLKDKGCLPPEGKIEIEEPESPIMFSSSMKTDHAPECEIDDLRVKDLYNRIKSGSSSELAELFELGGNLMYRPAMNALRKLGVIRDESGQDNFKSGTANYIATAWKKYDIEPLKIVSAWAYPFFEYKEYSNRSLKNACYATDDEDDFVNHISSEFEWCISNKVRPRFRLRESDDDGKYCVDVLIESKGVSTFHLAYEKNHFVGIFRVYNEIQES